ncbi:LacI family DNA-binding transcriptional regulator [Nafulsella turpanensis]|uniref:LacI family DNA-binding transcriptional regulator n=1 Tax=Nafulsella turpanensis TaxID=1265690 RepID=UPI0003460B91|nr:LacI family DNA-binding transcriptional regulator [Nafulsella turpanensis]
MTKQRQITLKDIAQKLDISVSTVSRALRNDSAVNAHTKKAISRMAKQLNFEINQVAQSLHKKKTKALGVIVPNLTNNYFAASISGIQDMAAKKGYNVIICQSNESYEKEVNILRTLANGRVDGLLISLSRETNNYDHLQKVLYRGIPLVLFDRICNEIPVSKIVVNDYDGAFKATEHLIQLGRSRIAHIAGPEHLSISKDRLNGYRDALQKYGMNVEQELIRYSSSYEQGAVEQTNELLNLPSPPDAIFAVDDPAAIQAMMVMKERGIKIPEEVAIIGFSNDPNSAHTQPTLSTVAQPAYEIGQIATKHILDQIHQPENSISQTITLNTELVLRNSSK